MDPVKYATRNRDRKPERDVGSALLTPELAAKRQGNMPANPPLPDARFFDRLKAVF